jgi:hypothetical protein
MVASSTGTPPAVVLNLSPNVSSPSTARLFLEITRGRTRFPRRPVTGPRFLIGAGVTCDLRLGGKGMPPLHSIITADEAGVHLEAIAPLPTLIVNGRGIHEVELEDGDVIGIGEVELLARLSSTHAPAAGVTDEPASAAVETLERPLAELSAAELIERIEAEERLMEQFEVGRQTGARALAEAVRQRVDAAPLERRPDSPRRHLIQAPHFLSKRPQVLAARGRPARAAEAPVVPASEPEFLRELEQLGMQLTSLSQELRTGSERATARESNYAEATDLLMETQHKLASQLETLLSQVVTMQQKSETPRTRAIA